MRPLSGLCALFLASAAAVSAGPMVDWRLDQGPNFVGEAPVTVLGNPQALADGNWHYAQFNGVSDGYIVERNPLEGWTRFSIELLVRADPDGEGEPRFLNIGDANGTVLTMEFRLGKDSSWALDGYVKQEEVHLKLFDETRRHPAGKWHWVALTYDGKTLTSYVDGQKELSGEVALRPFTAGRTSFGVRLNHVYWFKGGIAEFRATRRVLGPEELSR